MAAGRSVQTGRPPCPPATLYHCPHPPCPGRSARPSAFRPGRAACGRSLLGELCIFRGGEEARIALVQGLGGDSWVCLASAGASIWRPTPTPQGSHATDALGQADSRVCPPHSGAGVFFLSSAEGDQISFLFDCIVRGISPTKGPFGLRPVLPGECVVGGGDAWPGQRVWGGCCCEPPRGSRGGGRSHWHSPFFTRCSEAAASGPG